MLNLFYKNNGAISVFLSLVLLPVMLIGGMTTDAARVYMSKVIISDAGEMAMNAGLAQYNEVLHDEYGLFVMDKTPESMSGDLEGFFNASLNGTGVSGMGNYKKILDLMTESFHAIGVAGSEIYRTDVEKQQILEYMKYRAPVCIADLILKKLGELKDARKMMEAMEAEMDFSEAMEECQDAFEEAKEALDKLNSVLEAFPEQKVIEQDICHAEEELTITMARCLLMRAVIQRNNKKYSSTNLKDMVNGFVEEAKKVDLSGTMVYSESTYNNYIDAMCYKNTVESLGGVDKLLSDYDKDADDKDSESEEEDEERKELEELRDDYKEQKKRISDYPQILSAIAYHYVDANYSILNGYWTKSKEAKNLSKTAYDKLEYVEETLRIAADKFDNWRIKTSELGEKKAANMQKEIEKYQDFFSNGAGKSNLEELQILMNNVETDRRYFEELQDILTEEKFFDMSIAVTSPSTQIIKYDSEARSRASAQKIYYDSVEDMRKSYSANYNPTSIETYHVMYKIRDDNFYLALQEYCNKKEAEDSQNEQQAANEKMEDSKKAGEEANREDDYPDFEWSSAGVTLPSAMENASGTDADEALTNLNVEGNVKSKKARRGVISKFKDSLEAATSFLDAVDRIVMDNLEGLYIAEYAMQMGSYYTVNKEKGKEKASDEIITISGYKMENHKAYRAECEYVLWGKDSSKTNIRYTVMMIFGIRLLFNSFFAFTNGDIDNTAEAAAIAITGAAPYLKPIVKVVLKLGYAGLETASDLEKIKDGYGVTIIKNKETWTSGPFRKGDNTVGVIFDYSEYLRVFLNIALLKNGEESILGRIGDMIQVNTDTDITKDCYTMLSIQATVNTRTTFLGKASEWSGAQWQWGNSYNTQYQSILGY